MRHKHVLLLLMGHIGKMLIVLGLGLALIGLVVWGAERLGFGRLPGDLVFKGDRTTVYFPLVTSLVISVVLTVLLNLWFTRR